MASKNSSSTLRKLNTIDEAIADIKAGKIVIVVDDAYLYIYTINVRNLFNYIIEFKKQLHNYNYNNFECFRYIS